MSSLARILTSKQNFPLAFLAALALMVGWLASTYPYEMVPLALAGGVALILVLMMTFMDPFHGLLVNVVISYFVFLPQRVFRLPYSLAVVWEIQTLLLVLAAAFAAKGKPADGSGKALKQSPITWMIILFYLLALVEGLNPNISHKTGWLIALRRITPFVVSFFAAYLILDSMEKIRKFFRLTVILIIIATAYAYYQQFVGLPSFDLDYIWQSEEFYNRLYLWGILRKFSFLDVVTFPMLANLAALILLICVFFEKKAWKVLVYLGLALFLLVGATFSGTRAATFLLPAGMLLYSVINIQKPKALLVYIGLIACLFIVVNLPIYRFTTLNRYRSSFSGDDSSLELRNENRQIIQPYIHDHPIGGGLLTSGLIGDKMYPDHPLANFPPDSGLLMSAMEKGWIGLMIDMLLYLVIMIVGIKGFFRTEDQLKRKYLLISVCTVFSLVLAEYAQIVVTQIPVCMYFFPLAAIVIRLTSLDHKPETLSIKKK